MKGLNFLCLFCFFLLSGKPSDSKLNKPGIVAGKAKITGSIMMPEHKSKEGIIVTFIVLHPISGENVHYKVPVDQSGKFAVEVEVETDISLAGLTINLGPLKLLFVKLKSSGVTNIDIGYNLNNKIENVSVTPATNPNDITWGPEVTEKMIRYRSDRKPQPLYDKGTEYFLNSVKAGISEKLRIVENDTLLSKELKEVLSDDLRIWMYKINAFNYEEMMMLSYRNANDDKSKKYNVQKPERGYYRFLRELKLNEIQYLNCFSFQDIQKEILRNEEIRLPEIGESDIATWLKDVKAILADLVGFDNGMYYDILVANAYGRQLNEELRPLSDKQKKNIAKYWKNGEIAKILFRRNQKVLELDKFKSPAVVNDISSVVDDKVIEAILTKHKNKVVVIDFWATWCVPCLEAMEEFRSAKNEFHDKDVVFVYLTNRSSPKKLWEEKIKGIGSEHYYLNDTQWEYLTNHYDFKYIPSYLIYSKEGKLVNKFSAFPGSEKVKEMISGLL